MRVIIHPPIDPKKRAWKNASMIMPEKDYMTRNQDIVNAVEVLIACPGEMTEQLRSGTWSTIRKGIKKESQST